MANVFSMGEIYHMLQKKRASVLLKFQLGPSPPSPLTSPPPLFLPLLQLKQLGGSEKEEQRPSCSEIQTEVDEEGRFCLQA